MDFPGGANGKESTCKADVREMVSITRSGRSPEGGHGNPLQYSFLENLWTEEAAAAAAKLRQSCLTLCDPIDGSPPGSPVPGILRQEHWSGLPFPSPMHESEK